MEHHIDLTTVEEKALAAESLGEKIELIIDKLPPDEVTLHEIIEIVGVDSLLLLTIFLSLIFLAPVSIPGVSTVFGLGIILIGVTRLFALRPWLPAKVAHRKLSASKLREGFIRSLAWFRRLEKISRPHRLPGLTAGSGVMIMNNLAFIFAALLLMAPFGFVPLSNTLPALGLILLAVGMMQRDGALVLLGYGANVATVLYFGVLVAFGGLSLHQLSRLLG
ncbi:MAG TPA: exopolysaccharide biosynthesis protein [Chloroflexi bacterium]|nr:exopolysaccharide biosynthesis protein [Chloroflexota bacterium]HHW88234.1 exopolysaccharide biosynthesis protein [Chloroflexota bacterium]